MGEWRSIADLVRTEGEAGYGTAEVALLGVPMEAGSVTPGRCDLAPAAVRRVLRRFSTYDVESRVELDLAIDDLGDVRVTGVAPADGLAQIRDAVLASGASPRGLTIALGGNNAITRPAAHGLGVPLASVGLVTLDAHFDMRDTDQGMLNGNPVRALLEDGLPGNNICQIGLAPFANTKKMHRDALDAGITVWTIADCWRQGILAIIDGALARLAHTELLLIDFDIDVLDRSQCPGAPGARAGGMAAEMFFTAARRLASEPKVRLVDLVEFDPSLDLGDVTALTAGRWLCEILAGFSARPGTVSPRG